MRPGVDRSEACVVCRQAANPTRPLAGCYHTVWLIQVAAPTRATNPNLAAARLWMADGSKRRVFGLAVFIGG